MKCPECEAECEADFVDIGVGEQQCSPYHCVNDKCGWMQAWSDDLGLDEGEVI